MVHIFYILYLGSYTLYSVPFNHLKVNKTRTVSTTAFMRHKDDKKTALNSLPI